MTSQSFRGGVATSGAENDVDRPPFGSIAGFGEVLEYIALLLFEGGNDCHDSFSETSASFILGSKTHLAPEYTMASLSLAQVVGRFYAS